jgi:hypothetical protein
MVLWQQLIALPLNAAGADGAGRPCHGISRSRFGERPCAVDGVQRFHRRPLLSPVHQALWRFCRVGAWCPECLTVFDDYETPINPVSLRPTPDVESGR